jgi:hypothetical protein
MIRSMPIRSKMETFDHALPLPFDRKSMPMIAPESSQFVTCDHPVGTSFGGAELGLRMQQNQRVFSQQNRNWMPFATEGGGASDIRTHVTIGYSRAFA